MYDLNHYFQNAKVTKLLWAKIIVRVNGRVHKVKCKVCSKIKRHNKLLVSKLNFLWKHSGERNATITIFNMVAMGEYYFLKKINMCSMKAYMCQRARIMWCNK
jgi:hypothetical protein